MTLINRIKITSWLKIFFASLIAMILATILKLDFAISAGIVAILSVLATKRETVKTAFSRFIAFMAALCISFVFYNVLGFNIKAFVVYLFVFIALCQFFEWYSAMALDSVLISHFITFGQMGISEIKNELLLFIIGAGCGVIANIFLRKKTDLIESLKNQTDALIKQSLSRMGQRITNITLENFDGSCFVTIDESVFQAKKQAKENFKNQFKQDSFDMKYIDMRENQVRVLKEMYKTLSKVTEVPFTAKIISDFFEKVSTDYSTDNDVVQLLNDLHAIRLQMKTQILPANRSEFENRANLFTLLNLLEEFLTIKNEFFMSHQNRLKS